MTSAEFARFARVMRKMGATEVSVTSLGDYSAKFGSSARPAQQLVMLPSTVERAPVDKTPNVDDTRTDRQKYRDEVLETMRGG